MKPAQSLLCAAVCAALALAGDVRGENPGDAFAAPLRGFTSDQPAQDWQQGLLSGNGTMGALVMGNPYDETLYLSHAALYLPQPNSERYIQMASRLDEIRRICLAGDYRSAGQQISAARKEYEYNDERDPFIAAFALHVRHPEAKTTRYQRAVDFMTGETLVRVADGKGSFQRSAFVSRADGVVVLRVSGTGKQSADFSFTALPPKDDRERKVIAEGIKSSQEGVKDGLLYFRSLFAAQNSFNPNAGYEGVGKVISRGGTRTETATGIRITDADEILVLVRIEPLPKEDGATTAFDALQRGLDALPTDYAALLAPHAKAQGDLMGRVSLSLDAPATDRAKSSDQLNRESVGMDAPLAKIERAFDAGRYNIIASSGFHPPNLQGLWSATWLAPWSGSFTTNGNLPCAVSGLLLGNTPELLEPYFRYYEDRLPGFRENTKVFFGLRGFHVPPQLTLSPRETDFNPSYPHCFSHAGAAWACEYFYDYYQCTGDRKFLADRAYPLMKEAAAFYEDFLTVKDKAGKLVFVPSYSPENSPRGFNNAATSINATIEISAAKQLLRHAIAAAKVLDRDADLQAKWAGIIADLPGYEVGPDGSFREWLWPGLQENNDHRHASHLYALYDEMPAEIVDRPELVRAVEHTIRERLNFQERTGVMAFGVVQLGLAAAHVGNAALTQEVINFLGKGYWSAGMASFHNRGDLFNMDISGGFPYLCMSALVYSEPGHVRFFPARPAQWQHGCLKGVRLRGGIVVRELTWDGAKASAVLVADGDQAIEVDSPGAARKTCELRNGVETRLDL